MITGILGGRGNARVGSTGSNVWVSDPRTAQMRPGKKVLRYSQITTGMGAMKTLTKTILTSVIASSALLFLAGCGKQEPETASEAAADAAAQMDKAADSDEVKNAQKEAEAAAEEAKKAAEAATK